MPSPFQIANATSPLLNCTQFWFQLSTSTPKPEFISSPLPHEQKKTKANKTQKEEIRRMTSYQGLALTLLNCNCQPFNCPPRPQNLISYHRTAPTIASVMSFLLRCSSNQYIKKSVDWARVLRVKSCFVVSRLLL